NEAGLAEEDHLGRARALEQFLRYSEEFSYSLSAPQRDPEVDPIVDFLTTNRVGHCEYYSSALTLMLRSLGIKSRMIIGFKGGAWNSLGNYYQVRQSHAHSWTEAYISNRQIPGAETDVWLRLDPTPGSVGDEEEERTAAWMLAYEEWSNYTEYLWTNYVVGLDSQRQYEGIYAPLGDVFKFLKTFGSRAFWTEEMPRYIAAQVQSGHSVWLIWNGLLLIILVGAFIYMVRAVSKKIIRKWSRTQRRLTHSVRSAPIVDFYYKLEVLLRRYGLVKPASQTPREFAIAIGGDLFEKPHLQAVATVPRKIVEAYYRVCYGGKTLDQNELDSVNRDMQKLAMALRRKA
ncbi:MAG: transglutaminase domain-containing protein, partial [Planctomycetales bacterium]